MPINCPKCQYKRLPSDQAPEWQCPSCGVAYNKAAELADAPRHRTPTQELRRATYGSQDNFTGTPWLNWRTLKFAIPLITALAWLCVKAYGHYALGQSFHFFGTGGGDQKLTQLQREVATDVREAEEFLNRWGAAMDKLDAESRNLQSDGLDTPGYKAATAELVALEQEWKRKTFRNECVQGTKSILGDAMGSSRTFQTAYATTRNKPLDTGTERLLKHFSQSLDNCMTASVEEATDGKVVIPKDDKASSQRGKREEVM